LIVFVFFVADVDVICYIDIMTAIQPIKTISFNSNPFMAAMFAGRGIDGLWGQNLVTLEIYSLNQWSVIDRKGLRTWDFELKMPGVVDYLRTL